MLSPRRRRLFRRSLLTRSARFTDVSTSNPVALQIDQLARQKIINGFQDGSFHSAAPVTRQAFAAFLRRTLSLISGDGQCFGGQPRFADVPDESPFCHAINVSTGANVIRGCADGGFQPAATISRQAIAAFVERIDVWLRNGRTSAAATDAPCTMPTLFSDVTTSNPFCDDIEFLAKTGFSIGYSDGTYRPAASFVRDRRRRC